MWYMHNPESGESRWIVDSERGSPANTMKYDLHGPNGDGQEGP